MLVGPLLIFDFGGENRERLAGEGKQILLIFVERVLHEVGDGVSDNCMPR